MKSAVLNFLERLFFSLPQIPYLLFENQLFRNTILRKWLIFRPSLFEKYHQKKPFLNWSFRKKILIVKTDAIGDFVLFLNSLEIICQNNRYNDYDFFLLGNKDWEALALAACPKRIKGFFFINRKFFCDPKADPIYRMSFLFDVNQNAFDSAFYFSHSREYYAGDWIMRHLSARLKYASTGDSVCQNETQNWEGKTVYSTILQIPENLHFELEKNQALTNVFLGLKKANTQFILPDFGTNKSMQIDGNYAVLFPGANANWRQWPPRFFAEIALHLNQVHDLKIVVCGGPGDKILSGSISNSVIKASFYNFCGETSLMELSDLIRNASILISNETSAIHFAAALKTKSICISNGNHYGRFNPYEAHGFYFIKTIFPESLLALNESDRIKKYLSGSDLDISEIKSESVIEGITQILAG